MFEVNGVYANRKGEYTVLEITPPKMLVRYKDGTEASLKIELQERIWVNIAAEYEAQEAKAAKKKAKRTTVAGANHYIKVISIPDETENSFPGWPEKRIMGPADGTPELKSGDRLILYAVEYKCFFAVATITGAAKTTNPKDYFFPITDEKRDFFPIDVDTAVKLISNGAPVESVELETHPTFKRDKSIPESLLTINEDDFELLSEAISEQTEEENEIDDDLLDDDADEDDED